MTYKPLLDALAASGAKSRDMDDFIPAKGGQLSVATHDVAIASVDMSRLASQGCVKFVFEGDDGYHSETVWLLERDKPVLNWRFTNLLNSLCLRTEVYDAFQAACRELGDQAFNLFRGMRVRVTVAPGPGYRMHLTPTRQYVIVDAVTGTQLIPQAFASESDARRLADARGLKKSYNRITRYESVSDTVADANWTAFNSARAGLNRARESGVRIETGASRPTVAATTASHPERADTGPVAGPVTITQRPVGS